MTDKPQTQQSTIPEPPHPLPARCLVIGNSCALFECECVELSPTRTNLLIDFRGKKIWLRAAEFLEWLEPQVNNG